MSWLRDFFDQTQKIARLQRERDDAVYETESLESILSGEINSNRAREDALVDQIVALAGGSRTSMPRRKPLPEPGQTRRQSDDDGTLEQKIENAEFEERVEIVTQAFREEALKKGIEYNNDDLDILREKIRQNPSEYLEN